LILWTPYGRLSPHTCIRQCAFCVGCAVCVSPCFGVQKSTSTFSPSTSASEQAIDPIICLFIHSPDPHFSRYMILDVLLPPYPLLCPMTISSSIKTEFKSSIYSMALYLVAQQPHQFSIYPNMADPLSSPPMRTKPEPMDSLSPSTSVELRRRSKTGCVFAA
jgi:hypothetical protein